MPDFPLLPGPRHGWLGGLLEGCASVPAVGRFFARFQRVRRKRFQATVRADPAWRRRVADSAAGRIFQEALTQALDLPVHGEPLSPMPGAPGNPNIRCSVIINTVDRASDLAITLADLAPHWRADLDELILVLGPTSDDSREMILRSGLPCRVIDCPERNLAVSRNLGLAAAVGEFVAFLDDDASPSGTWLEALLEPLIRYPSAGASAGFAQDGAGQRYLTRYVVSDRLGRSTWWDGEDEARDQIAKLGPERAFLTATGCNMAFRRQRLLDFGGFDPFYAYFLEETDLVLRLHDAGHPCLTCPASVVRHRQGANAARSPEASLEARQTILRSQLHYIRKFGFPTYPRTEIESCVWQRVLVDLERIAWDAPHQAASLQIAYLSGICRF